MIFRKEGTAENGDVDFEKGDIGTSAHWYWSLLFLFFGERKKLLKVLLTGAFIH